MQVDADQSVCPACRAGRLEIVPVLHHMICAYVGPVYDFAATEAGYGCPKCRREIRAGARDCEIVGASARCRDCGREMIVSPPAPPGPAPGQSP